MPILNMTDVSLKLGSKYVLTDINWRIEDLRHWVVYGLNGSGKTSLLSVASAYMGASKGNVDLFGEKVGAENKADLRKRIGLVSSSFFDRYYKYENILDIVLSGRCGVLGLDSRIAAKDIRRAKRWLAEFGLRQKAQYPYDSLSQGQKQKVLIARALFIEPQLLILDEPCSGMDIIAKERFLQTLVKLAQERGTALVYVSHNTDEFLPLFTHALLLKTGKIFKQGSMNEVFTSDNLSAFLERPAVAATVESRITVRIKEER